MVGYPGRPKTPGVMIMGLLVIVGGGSTGCGGGGGGGGGGLALGGSAGARIGGGGGGGLGAGGGWAGSKTVWIHRYTRKSQIGVIAVPSLSIALSGLLSRKPNRLIPPRSPIGSLFSHRCKLGE